MDDVTARFAERDAVRFPTTCTSGFYGADMAGGVQQRAGEGGFCRRQGRRRAVIVRPAPARAPGPRPARWSRLSREMGFEVLHRIECRVGVSPAIVTACVLAGVTLVKPPMSLPESN